MDKARDESVAEYAFDRISGLGIQDVLPPRLMPEYTRLAEHIWTELVEAHTNLAIIRVAHTFPRTLLVGNDEGIDWLLRQLLLMTIVIVHRVKNDRGADVLTIGRLRNLVTNNIAGPHEAWMRERLRQARPTAEQKRTLTKIGKIRDCGVAHKLVRLEEIENALGINAEEIRDVLGVIVQEYLALRPGVGVGLVVEHPVEQFRHSLEVLVLNSDYSRIHDENLGLWKNVASNISETELGRLNEIRIRHGKQPIRGALLLNT